MEEVLFVDNLVADQSNEQNLDYLSFFLDRGEVLGITGLNGDGLNVLSEILTGRLMPSSGRIYYNCEKIELGSENAVRQLGILEITEKASVIPFMTVAENMFLTGNMHSLRLKQISILAEDLIAHYSLKFHSGTITQKLSIAQKMEVSICRAIRCGAKILICHEVGEGFTEMEMVEFAHFLRQLCDEDVSVLLMNSNPAMSLRFADRIAVMRNGMICYERKCSEASLAKIQEYMAVQSVTVNKYNYRERDYPCKEVIFDSIHISGYEQYKLTFTLRTGEIIGIVGKTRDEETPVYDLFTGKIQAQGTVWEKGNWYSFASWKAKNHSYIYALRKYFWKDAIFGDLTVGENITFLSYKQFWYKAGVMNKNMLSIALLDFTNTYKIDKDILDLYPRHLDTEARNQIVLWRLLFCPPKLLVLDSPCFAIDEKTRQYLLYCVETIKQAGTLIVWANNNDASLKTYCDRIVCFTKNN